MRFPFILLLFWILSFHVSAQDMSIPVLEREISIHANNQPIESILSQISSQGGFVFSYNPKAINSNNLASLQLKNKPVRYALNSLFNDDISYKVKGKYIILRKSNKTSNSEEETRIFEGYIYDSRTGQRLTEASIYNKNLLASAVTDKYGHFSMELPANTPLTALKVSKLGYSDSVFVSSGSLTSNTLEVALKQRSHPPTNPTNGQFLKKVPDWLIPNKISINSLNINDSIFRAFQLSLAPLLSTNHFLGGNTSNHVSINATVGYVQGIRIVEFGGIVNIVRNNVSYAQFAGVGNIVGGNVKGFQAGGVFNFANSVKGMQAAGVINKTQVVKGTQASGVINIAYDTAMVQLSGVYSSAKVNSVQASGVLSMAKETKVQIAGVTNLAKEAEVQISGVLNHTQKLGSTQIAGVVNNTGEGGILQVAGCVNNSNGEVDIQISGFFNKAKTLRRLQIGIINIADSVTGMPIGLVSYARNGYHKLELSADDLFPVNVAFRTGVEKFHTFCTLGANPLKQALPLTMGIGFGTSFGQNPKTKFDLDFASHELVSQSDFSFQNHLYRLYAGIDHKITAKASIMGGLSLNAMLADTYNPEYQKVYSLLPLYSFINRNYSNGHNLKMWIGARIGFRFF